MIKTKTVTLEGNDLVRSLERTQYEMEAHKDLLAWMINNKYDITASAYQKYHNEYTDLFIQYQKLKYQFEQEYVRANIPANNQVNSWNLDYKTEILTIEYND